MSHYGSELSAGPTHFIRLIWAFAESSAIQKERHSGPPWLLPVSKSLSKYSSESARNTAVNDTPILKHIFWYNNRPRNSKREKGKAQQYDGNHNKVDFGSSFFKTRDKHSMSHIMFMFCTWYKFHRKEGVSLQRELKYYIRVFSPAKFGKYLKSGSCIYGSPNFLILFNKDSFNERKRPQWRI